MNFLNYFAIALILPSNGLLAAQDEPIKTEILTVALGKSFGDLFFKPGKEVRPLGAKIGSLSQPMIYVGPPILVVHDRKEDFDPLEKGEKPPKPVAVVKLPHGADRVLFVCQQKEAGTVKVRAYDISTRGQKAGDYRFFNFTGFPIWVNMGKDKFAIKAKQERLVSNRLWRSNVLDIPIQLGMVIDKKKTLVYSTMWGHRPAKRNMVFLFGSSDRNRPISIGRFYDYPGQEAISLE